MKRRAGEPMIRAARPEEARRLSELAFRSKAHWGYSDAFMKASLHELSVAPEDIERHPTYVLDEAGAPVGFYSLEVLSSDEIELNHLFIEPASIGGGRGGALLDHAVSRARAAGARVLVIQSDPNAEAFYTARGAVRVGERESGSVPGRMLPLLELALRPDA